MLKQIPSTAETTADNNTGRNHGSLSTAHAAVACSARASSTEPDCSSRGRLFGGCKCPVEAACTVQQPLIFNRRADRERRGLIRPQPGKDVAGDRRDAFAANLTRHRHREGQHQDPRRDMEHGRCSRKLPVHSWLQLTRSPKETCLSCSATYPITSLLPLRRLSRSYRERTFTRTTSLWLQARSAPRIRACPAAWAEE